MTIPEGAQFSGQKGYIYGLSTRDEADKETLWSDAYNQYVTSVYGLNSLGKRIVKYQVLTKDDKHGRP